MPLHKMHIYEVLNAARDIEKQADRTLADLGVTGARLLITLEEMPGSTPRALARLTHQEPHSISGMLKRLENRGMVSRERGDIDHRLVFVFLTQKGRLALPAIHATMEIIQQWWKET